MFTDNAVGNEEDTIGHVFGKAHFVGYDDHGHAAFGKLFHNGQYFAHHFGVQSTGRFIEEHDIGVHGQGTGNGHTLLLTAGKLMRIAFGFFFQTNAAEEFQGALFGLFFAHFFEFHRGQHDIFLYGEVGKEVETLEHHTDFFTDLVDIGFFVGDDMVIHDDLTVGFDRWLQENLLPGKVEIDEKLLSEIAESTGGRYFRATDNTKLAEIYSEINKMEKARTTVDSFPIYKELFGLYALLALLALLLELLLNWFVIRRLP